MPAQAASLSPYNMEGGEKERPGALLAHRISTIRMCTSDHLVGRAHVEKRRGGPLPIRKMERVLRALAPPSPHELAPGLV